MGEGRGIGKVSQRERKRKGRVERNESEEGRKRERR